MAWTIRIDPRAQKELLKLDRPIQRKIIRYLESRVAVADSPESLAKSLAGPLSGLCRYRIEDYRVVCRINREQSTVLVLAIGHRRDIYERLP